MKTLPGINIQYPISRRIIDGSKCIETRTYPLPKQYEGKDLYIVETPGPSGDFRARIIGVIRFSKSFKYESKKSFQNDFHKHLVDSNSPYAWKSKAKWGWVIERVIPLSKEVKAPPRRGIVFTKAIGLEARLQ